MRAARSTIAIAAVERAIAAANSARGVRKSRRHRRRVQGGAGRYDFQAAAEPALAQRPAGSRGMWPSSGCSPPAPRRSSPLTSAAPADPGAEGEHRGRTWRFWRRRSTLAQKCGVGIVFHDGGKLVALLDRAKRALAFPGVERGNLSNGAPFVERARRADADGGKRFGTRGEEGVDGVMESRHGVVEAGGDAGGDARLGEKFAGRGDQAEGDFGSADVDAEGEHGGPFRGVRGVLSSHGKRWACNWTTTDDGNTKDEVHEDPRRRKWIDDLTT